jgi:glycosyltransferase involved in cell wall biosynthesis
MLSILIPTYNYNVYNLTKEIHSQFEGLAIAFEIIVLDDGSKDFQNENQKIKSLSHVTYLYSEKNIGRSANRAKLADLATYSWLLFLDSDVLPYRESFIQKYVSNIQQTDKDVIFGGITYQKEKPPQELLLRWHYGSNREAKNVNEREKSPYFIISQNLLIKKETFIAANIVKDNYYGLDNFFSNQLKRLNAKVSHIDNPVIHLGLEANEAFIKKALKAVETTVLFEEKGWMDIDERPLQKSFSKLKKLGLTKPLGFLISKFKKPMEHNFNSPRPNLFWFDLYRLAYYIELKNRKNA